MLDDITMTNFGPESDGSGSGATQYSMNHLVDTFSGVKANESNVDKIIDKLVNWTPSDLFGDFSLKQSSLLPDDVNPNAYVLGSTEVPERSVPTTESIGKKDLDSNDNVDYDLGDNVNDWLKFIDYWRQEYNKQSQKNAQTAMDFEADWVQKAWDKQDENYKHYYKNLMDSLSEAGINPLLAIQNISSPTMPTYTTPSGFNASTGNYNYNSLFGSLLSSSTALKGQNKTQLSNIINDIIRLLPMLMMFFA